MDCEGPNSRLYEFSGNITCHGTGDEWYAMGILLWTGDENYPIVELSHCAGDESEMYALFKSPRRLFILREHKSLYCSRN